MSTIKKLSDGFAVVYDRSPYSTQDPISKIQYIAKGNNVVFGRTTQNKNQTNLIYLGKIIENTYGKNLLSANAWLDISFPHVIYITGARGSGKSFDLGVLLEGISKLEKDSPIQSGVDSICSVLIDTQSQFWTLAYPPNSNIAENAAQIEDLGQWNIPPGSIKNLKLFIPPNSKKFTGKEEIFTLSPKQLTLTDWCGLLKEDIYSSQGHILGRVIEYLADTNFSIEEMISHVSNNANWQGIHESSRHAVIYKLDNYRRSGLFSSSGLHVKDLLIDGQTSVFMLRDLSNEDKSLVTSVIGRQLFLLMGDYHQSIKIDKFFDKTSIKEKLPSKVWLLIDEAHVVVPSDSYTPARDVLVEYVKRGRDSGLSLVLATQQPSAVDDKILSQVNITFSHRLTFQSDINAVINRIPTKLISNLKVGGIQLANFGDILRCLESGQCFLGDSSTSRVVMLQVRPRITSHGGYNPI